ncbi:MAG: protein kinase [Myxococcales bacterium]|nr:protein kinase [Myxococcales bacterium]
MATFFQIGQPAHDAERQAIHFLVEGLPDSYIVVGNPWIVERTGVIYEIDALVIAPHAIYVIEIKSYRGRIEGTDTNWYLPQPIASPLRKIRVCAQVLNSRLRHENYEAGRVWVQELVYLSATTDVGIKGPASDGRIFNRSNILAALQDESLVLRLSRRSQLVPTGEAMHELNRIFAANASGPTPARQIREYDIIDTLSFSEQFSELLGKNRLTHAERVLRVYSIPPNALQTQRESIQTRARWESQVLARLGRTRGILFADQPFEDEIGIVLPTECFHGITLSTWLEKYGSDQKGDAKTSVSARVELWLAIAQTLEETHRHGVVHRLLRPEVILVADTPNPKADEIRVTGFEFAKQLTTETTVYLTSVSDDRRRFAAPEVISRFSDAQPASDQFSLGALLGLLLTGRPLFDWTHDLLLPRRPIPRVRDLAPRIPLRLDETVARMVQLRPSDRFPTLSEAILAVRQANTAPQIASLPGIAPPQLDPDNLAPRTRIGTDYEIITRLGDGGFSTVYAARHLISGHIRALKVGTNSQVAEESLRREYDVLSRIDHPTIVRVIDLSKMVEGRHTLVMERVSGQTLRQKLSAISGADAQEKRSLSLDLLSSLEFLEQRGITHKDIKPENLLVADGRLVLIDFSLAGSEQDPIFGGTANYRDPASLPTSSAYDRFAAAMCLFEIYAGHHPFDGKVPEPDQEIAVSMADIDPPGLAAFFRKALNPVPEQRFPSTSALRDTFLAALGQTIPNPDAPSPSLQHIDRSTPLSTTSLSARAQKALAGNAIHTVSDLLSLSKDEIHRLYSIGTKAAAEVIRFQQELNRVGLTAPQSDSPNQEPPTLAQLGDNPEPVETLAISRGVGEALQNAGYTTVGQVARTRPSILRKVPGIGQVRLSEIVFALRRLAAQSTPQLPDTPTLDSLWHQASLALTDSQRLVVERHVGLTGDPETQAALAKSLGESTSQLKHLWESGFSRINRKPLEDLHQLLLATLQTLGGIVCAHDIAGRLEETWRAGAVSGVGICRLLLRLWPDDCVGFDIDGTDSLVITQPHVQRDSLRAFVGEVLRLAEQWPPTDPEAARRTLARVIPTYDGDPLALAVRLVSDVEWTDAGHLVIPPLDAPLALEFVLKQIRGPLSLDELRSRVLSTFGESTPYPDLAHLAEIVGKLHYKISGTTIFPELEVAVLAPPKVEPDPFPPEWARELTPAERVRQLLRQAQASRGFRMIITPPETHREISRSIARVLKAQWVSFEDRFFTDHAQQMSSLERAERFVAQRYVLTDAAEETLFRLLNDLGKVGSTVVVGDTALFGVCDALDLPRRFYDETLSGAKGFWVLVIPGVIHKRQPLFNEGPAMWHLEGATLPLTENLPEG